MFSCRDFSLSWPAALLVSCVVMAGARCCHGWGLGLVGWQIAALALFSWIVGSICCCPVYSHFLLTSRDSFLAAATWCYRLLPLIQSQPQWHHGTWEDFFFMGPTIPLERCSNLVVHTTTLPLVVRSAQTDISTLFFVPIDLFIGFSVAGIVWTWYGI